MFIKQAQARKIKNSKNCTVWEYDLANKDLSYATALIDGRYPERKRATNAECEQIYYVISGSGTVHSEKGEFKIGEGDLYHFEKGEIYWVEGSQLFLTLVNAPKWTLEQYRIVD
jgi:mannose-6-phosphate isomerase-like protein (cupin superfamily)